MSELPSLSCVETAMRSVAEVEKLRVERRLVKHRIPHSLEMYEFSYSFGEERPLVRLKIEGEQVTFENVLIVVDRRLPQELINALRPVMVDIELAIEERCAPGLRSRITETCLGVRCGETAVYQ